MKKLSLILLLLSTILIFTACSKKSVPSSEKIYSSILKSQNFESLTELNQNQIQNYTGIDFNKLISYKLGIDASRLTPEAIYVLTAADINSANKIKELLELYLFELSEEYRDYLPEQLPKIENAKIFINQQQVVLVICKDISTAENAIYSNWK